MEQKYHDAIKKIVQLTRQDSEFDAELRKALGVNIAPSEAVDKSKVQRIEKYLGLDYYVDGQPSLVDYSFINEEDVRNQLICDNREMMRYRYGTRYHAIDFGEYCRYAHLQVEMLLNYFYNNKHQGDLAQIKEHIKQFNGIAALGSVKSIGAISYTIKLWAFYKEFNFDFKVKNVLDNICKVRNGMSHRSPEEDESKLVEGRKRLIAMGLPLNSEGRVNTYNLKEGTTERNLYYNMVKDTDWYKDYCIISWIKSEPYEDVKDAIKEFSIIIKDKLKF